MRKKILLILPVVFIFFVLSSLFIKSTYACTFPSRECVTGTTYHECQSFNHEWGAPQSCGSGQVCAFAGGQCYTPCNALADFCVTQIAGCNAANGGVYNNNSNQNAYCTASNNDVASYCCRCHLFFCDASCNEWYPRYASFMTCGQSSTLYASNTSACNGVYINGTPLSCPINCATLAAATNLSATYSDTPASETFTWTAGGAAEVLWYCDQTLANNTLGSNGQPIQCTRDSTPTNGTTSTNANHIGWYIWATDNTSPVGPTNAPAAGYPLVAGHTYSWFIRETLASCAPVDADSTFTYAATTHNVTINVLQDTTQTCSSSGGYSGATVTVSPAINGVSSFTTNSSGQISIANVLDGTYNFTLNVPSGYSVVDTCTPNSSTYQAIVNGANTTFTWYIHRYSISGYVFVDENKDAIKNGGESNYTGSPPLTISICPGQYCSTGGTPITATGGVFDTGYTLPAGAYTVSASGFSGDYSFTTPPTLAPTIGNPCSPSNGVCDSSYNVYNLHFGISNMNAWIQSTGGDIYEKGGISNPIPKDTTCTGGSNMSVSQNPIDFPGIVFTGGLASFGQGFPSATLDNHWLVSGSVTFTQSQTSYASIKNKAQAANITPTALPCDSGSYANGCVMPNDLEPGVYIADGNLKLAGTGTPASYTFPDNSDYVILVNGTLDIETEIHFSANHNSTALFTAVGDITVGGDVGTAVSTSTAPTIEGYYSAGGSFIVNNSLNNPSNSNCPTKDKKLNIQGAIVANANGAGGSFQLKRDMCEDDLCPTFSIQARPDFVLNAPLFYQSPTRIWQEMAP